MGAPEGNKSGIKLKDPEIRQLAYQQFCDHIAHGLSKKSWYFIHPSLSCTYETIEKYIKDEVEFDPIHKKIAEAKGFGYWEGVVHSSATGQNKDANTASLQMVMRNKFDWDKVEKEDKVSDETSKAYQMVADQMARALDERKP
jgi:hypothetical protein